MGNCFFLIKVCNENSRAGSAFGKCKKDERVLKEFTAAPMLVKDMLTKYSSSGVGSWSEHDHDLPLGSDQLKLGNSKTYDYNLLPAASSPTPTCFRSTLTVSAGSRDEVMKDGGGVKRIKVVIRKQELHELLSNQQQVPLPLIIGELLSLSASGHPNPTEASSCTRNYSTYSKPKLVSIPEDNEL